MLIAVIVGCEIGFWVLLGAGLVARYLLGWRRTGAALLVCVPLVDLVLFGASVADLRRGAQPSTAHGLAAAYLGYSVAFGHDTIRWADERFAHYVKGGPAPVRRRGLAHEWRLFGLAVVGWAVACALLGAGVLLVGDVQRAAPLLAWIGRLSAVLGLWLVFGPVWELLASARRRLD